MKHIPLEDYEYTECEVYRGFTIGIHNGMYAAFRNGKRANLGRTTSRADMRDEIDATLNVA